MIRILLIVFSLICTPAFAADDAGLWKQFLGQVVYLASQSVDVTEDLIESTKTVFEDYRKIFEVPNQAANKTDVVKRLTHDFAGAFEKWSLDVARNSQGSASHRAEIQRTFCSNFLRILSVFSPAHSQDVEREFESDILHELDTIRARQERQANVRIEAYKKRVGRVSLTEGIASVTVAITVFEALRYYTGAVGVADGASVAAFFSAYAGMKWGISERPDPETTALLISRKFNEQSHHICDLLLHHS